MTLTVRRTLISEMLHVKKKKKPQTQENIIFILNQGKNSTMKYKKSSGLAIRKENYPNYLGKAK